MPSVKSLLVRARASLAEAAEARLLTCAGRSGSSQVAEGLAMVLGPCGATAKLRPLPDVQGRASQDLQGARGGYPIGPLLMLKKPWVAKLGVGGASAGGHVRQERRRWARNDGDGGRRGRCGWRDHAGGAVSAGVSALASKAAAGMAAAVIVTAGAVEVRHRASDSQALPTPSQVAATRAPAPARPAPSAPAAVEAEAARAEGGLA